MTDDYKKIWDDMVTLALTSDSPTHGDEAIIQADLDLKRHALEIANISFRIQILETRVQRILTGSSTKAFSLEELE